MPRPRAILTDIEGTTTPIAFVHDVLFPYARARLPQFLEEHGSEPEVAGLLAQLSSEIAGQAALPALLAWMDADAKVTVLKTLQGLIWTEGYRKGELTGQLYPDVAPALSAWRADGLRLNVYSSGSEAAQRLLFEHSQSGDLASLFDGFFDTRIGPKRDPSSYTRIALAAGVDPGHILFLSDVEAELDAAASAGLTACQLVRQEDGTIASHRHPTAASFDQVGVHLR